MTDTDPGVVLVPIHKHPFGGDAAWRRRNAVVVAHAMIDPSDAEAVGGHYWSMSGHKYAATYVHRRTIYLHVFVIYGLGLQPAGIHVEHRNAQKLDCQRSNLRPVTQQVNFHNRADRLRANNTSGARGVSRRGSRWGAWIWVNRSLYLGSFDTKEEASAAVEAARDRLVLDDAATA